MEPKFPLHVAPAAAMPRTTVPKRSSPEVVARMNDLFQDPYACSQDVLEDGVHDMSIAQSSAVRLKPGLVHDSIR